MFSLKSLETFFFAMDSFSTNDRAIRRAKLYFRANETAFF